jgi:toxin ParE1/3/4
MNRLRFTKRATSDLVDIARYIARDNPIRAESFSRELREACHACGQFPRAGRYRDDIAGGVFVRPYRSYLILYTVRDETVLIRRVVHGSRDMRRLRAR